MVYNHSTTTTTNAAMNRGVRTSSSYPDLRQQEASWVSIDDRWQFYDDTHVANYQVSGSNSLHHRSWHEESIQLPVEAAEQVHTKTIQVDTFVICMEQFNSPHTQIPTTQSDLPPPPRRSPSRHSHRRASPREHTKLLEREKTRVLLKTLREMTIWKQRKSPVIVVPAVDISTEIGWKRCEEERGDYHKRILNHITEEEVEEAKTKECRKFRDSPRLCLSSSLLFPSTTVTATSAAALTASAVGVSQLVFFKKIQQTQENAINSTTADIASSSFNHFVENECPNEAHDGDPKSAIAG